MYRIELTETGFTPQTITIAKGDMVTFTTSRGEPFWPASNLHPSHTIYPEFDPKEPVASNSSWSFTFTKPGEWKFHDHLAPLYIGTITVRDRDDTQVRSPKAAACQGEESAGGGKISCWSEVIRTAIRDDGVAEGMNAFEVFYKSEPDFAENCHSFTHIIGEASYDRFQTGENLNLTAQIAYCSYGFFHGFIETMMQKEGNLKNAHNFCLKVDKELSGELYTLGPCFHGLGHGITDASDPRAIGNEAALIREALQTCSQIGGTEYETKMCATGVFNSLAIMYQDAKYNLKLDRADPYAFCRTVENKTFKEACYEDFKILPMAIENNNFAKAARYVEDIAEDRFAFAAMDTVSSFAIYFMLRDKQLVDNAVRVCYSLQERLWGSCIAGLGAGLLGQGTPDEEYTQALGLCESKVVEASEKDACYQRVVRLISLRYSREKTASICKTIPAQYQPDCVYSF